MVGTYPRGPTTSKGGKYTFRNAIYSRLTSDSIAGQQIQIDQLIRVSRIKMRVPCGFANGMCDLYKAICRKRLEFEPRVL